MLIIPFIPQEFLDFGNLREWTFDRINRGQQMEANTQAVNNVVENLPYGDHWMHDFSLSVNRSPIIGYVKLMFWSIWPIGLLVYTMMTIICTTNIKRIKQSIVLIKNKEVVQRNY